VKRACVREMNLCVVGTHTSGRRLLVAEKRPNNMSARFRSSTIAAGGGHPLIGKIRHYTSVLNKWVNSFNGSSSTRHHNKLVKWKKAG
jgi:hypothetical protein